MGRHADGVRRARVRQEGREEEEEGRDVAPPPHHQNAALVWPKSMSAPLLFLHSTLLLSYSAVRERGLDGWMDVQEVNDGCRRWVGGGEVD